MTFQSPSGYNNIKNSLSVSDGGLGVRGASMLALSAFLASAAGTQRIQDQILSQCSILEDHLCSRVQIHILNSASKCIAAEPPMSFVQPSWDRPAIIQVSRMIEDNATDVYSKARLLAITTPHSGTWLRAQPISTCGLRLDNDRVNQLNQDCCRAASGSFSVPATCLSMRLYG